ncbi:Protein of unknown function [Gryllus bimaculatus]|nr:Protein of unknown function [Gryllus bimaculatus]
MRRRACAESKGWECEVGVGGVSVRLEWAEGSKSGHCEYEVGVGNERVRLEWGMEMGGTLKTHSALRVPVISNDSDVFTPLGRGATPSAWSSIGLSGYEPLVRFCLSAPTPRTGAVLVAVGNGRCAGSETLLRCQSTVLLYLRARVR